jgi:AcrR family transcriptional regulator
MKREEKNQLTRSRILSSAAIEFAKHGYEAASLNTVCQNGNISKGIIYHYFMSKDDLYLACLADCMERLNAYMREGLSQEVARDQMLNNYFDLRLQYFREHETDASLFCNAALFPPEHLKEKILALRKDFDETNDAYILRFLKQSDLRQDLSVEDILHVFRRMQDYFNVSDHSGESTFADVEQHEKSIRNVINIFLYGIIARR